MNARRPLARTLDPRVHQEARPPPSLQNHRRTFLPTHLRLPRTVPQTPPATPAPKPAAPSQRADGSAASTGSEEEPEPEVLFLGEDPDSPTGLVVAFRNAQRCRNPRPPALLLQKRTCAPSSLAPKFFFCGAGWHPARPSPIGARYALNWPNRAARGMLAAAIRGAGVGNVANC